MNSKPLSSLTKKSKHIVSLCLLIALTVTAGACSPKKGSATVAPQDGLWVGNLSGGGTLSLSISDQQIEYVDYSEFITSGGIQGNAHCVIGSKTPIRPDGTFSNKDTTGKIDGAFNTSSTGHVSFEFMYCSAVTTQGQPASFQGTLRGETQITPLQ